MTIEHWWVVFWIIVVLSITSCNMFNAYMNIQYKDPHPAISGTENEINDNHEQVGDKT